MAPGSTANILGSEGFAPTPSRMRQANLTHDLGPLTCAHVFQEDVVG